MKTDFLIPQRIDTWAAQWPILGKLLDSPYGRILDAAFERLDPAILYKSETHGSGHIERTMLYGALICMNEATDTDLARDVICCCALHDIGRLNDKYDEEHGMRSADRLVSLGLDKCFHHPAEACAAIHAHSAPDSRMSEAPAVYGAQDGPVFRTLAKCLKDADNLDRVRIFDFDSSFLRFKSTKEMETLAYFLLNEFTYIPTVLCIGDSNTFGYNPVTKGRYPKFMRFPDSLQQLLGPGRNVVGAGMNGRTAVRMNGFRESPEADLEDILYSNFPVDTLVFMLGTNDCTARFAYTAEQITAGMERLIVHSKSFLIQIQGFEPEVILIAPRSLDEKILKGAFGQNENENTIAVSKQLPALYEELASKRGCGFISLENVLELSPVDGMHLQGFGGLRIAKKVASLMLGRPFE